MSNVGQPERFSQNRIVKLFQDELDYIYLGDWQDREGNSNIEEELLIRSLQKRGYKDKLIAKAIRELKRRAAIFDESLYHTNKAVYSILRYGADIKPELGKNTEKVHFIDWKNPEENDFYIAEEVTIKGEKTKRPDIVLYVNGIALGVLELKRSTVSIGDGIRQNITNQQDRFIQPFFATMQLVMAGSDTEGLRYGTIGTPEKWFLNWKEDIEDGSRLQLDKYLIKICNKQRLLEIIHDFVLFDGGIKKLPRVHQYFGIKAAQKNVRKREGGIIWHTQGSGKSIVMVLLAKWLLENNPRARVAVITDRTELDDQIKDVFTDVGQEIYQCDSGNDLIRKLEQARPRLLCSLVHKFGKRNVDNFEWFIKDLEAKPSKAVGEVFLFIDECHRTQSGKLHRTMKAILPNAVFIGFTGTPLLKKDKQTSLEVFGKYIHTYKFNEAVADEIVHDLVYDARDIDQKLSSPDKVDKWFEAKTRGLNDFQKAELKKKWGTMQKVLSSRSRMDRIVTDVVGDFGIEHRLSSGRGNAILVATSIYEACRYYELFQKTPLKGQCAVVTSYNPQTKDITTEDSGSNTETQREYIYNIYEELLKDVQPKPNKSKTEVYEDYAKDKFKKEPAFMQLLIVVDKLLTGFDAPSCTYIYIDKSMRDHGLFQAVCRVNRLDTEDKLFGHIIDYKDLFKNLMNEDGTGALQVYTEELDFDDFEKEDVEILMKDRLEKGKERLDNAREELALLCEPVPTPRGQLEYQRFFCGNTEIPEDLKKREPLRTTLYRKTVAFIRSYANIADTMAEAGYSAKDIADIKKEMDFYLKLREEIKMASGETIDLKAYEADMRHLIDNYIQADDPRQISQFGDLTLLEIITNTGINEAINSLPKDTKSSQEAVAETIENNVRQKIIKEHLVDPAFFEEMSRLLASIIKERKNQAISYEEYLRKIAELANQVQEGRKEETPDALDTKAKRRLYNNLGEDLELTLRIDTAVRTTKKADWKGDIPKELEIKGALYEILQDRDEVERIFLIVREQEEY